MDQSRDEVSLRIPTPKTHRQAWEFGELLGFAESGFQDVPKWPSLYELTGPKENPLNWTEKQQKACDELRLPDLKPFPL